LIVINAGIKTKKKMLPLLAGDVPATYTDVSGYKPNTTHIEEIKRFIEWYKNSIRFNQF